jgi:hypothetical protein
MGVNIFHNNVKKKICKVIKVVPKHVYRKKWCQNMFPKIFYSTFLHNNMNKNIICCKPFFDYLYHLITEKDKHKDSYVQCVSILLKYAALIFVNSSKGREDPYYFLSWFNSQDITRVLIWDQKENIDRTMFRLMEHLKLEHIVFSTIISHLVTASFETMSKCKNLIQYWKMVCGLVPRKPIKVVSETGILEKDAIKIRQIFEHLRISKSILDNQVGHSSSIAILRGEETPYKNSEFLVTYKYKSGHKNIFIPIKDDLSTYKGLLLYDSKKSKMFELDYLNTLILYSLTESAEYLLVDSIVFRHDLIISSTNELYDPLSGFLYHFTNQKESLDDYQYIIQGINELICWSRIGQPNNIGKPYSNRSDKEIFNKSQCKDYNILNQQHILADNISDDDYEKSSLEFTVAISDFLLYHYQVGDIESKFKKLTERGRNSLLSLL